MVKLNFKIINLARRGGESGHQLFFGTKIVGAGRNGEVNIGFFVVRADPSSIQADSARRVAGRDATDVIENIHEGLAWLHLAFGVAFLIRFHFKLNILVAASGALSAASS